jgi:phytoene dehydrogenase-like protein
MHMKRESDRDVVVIGGGLGGLTASIYAARLGSSVTLVERSRVLGGRARTDVRDGFHANLGPHALYRGGPGMRVLKELGIHPAGGTPKSSGQYAINRGIKHTFPTGMFSMLTTGLFDLAAKLEAARLLASFPKIDASEVTGISVQEWVDREITHPGVRQFMLAVFRLSTYANAPELLSAGVAIEQLKLAVKESVLYVDDGWQTLVDSLVKIAQEAGIAIRTGAKASRIERDSLGAVKGVYLDGGESIVAASVVIAATPAVALELVDRASAPSLRQWAEEAVPVRAACLDVALAALPKPKSTFALGIDAPLYLSVHSASARLAPDGAAMIHLGKYLAPGEAGSVRAERELESVLDLIQPGWREEVVFRRFLPELTVYNAIPLAGQVGLDGRPGAEVSDVPGLFVAGDWVGRDGLLVDATLASAKLAGELAARAVGRRADLAAAI